MRQAPLRHAPGTFPCLVPKGSAKLAKNTACPAYFLSESDEKMRKSRKPESFPAKMKYPSRKTSLANRIENPSSGFPMLRNRNFKVFYVNPLAFRIKSIVLCPSKRVYPLRAFLLKINQ